jgi:NADPH-dependent ferric siderophore reductase
MMDDIINQVTASPMETSIPARRVQRVRHELRRRDVQVAQVQPMSPGFVAITFTGPDLADFVSPGFDDHVKFMFQPVASPEAEPLRRDYTPRRFDNQACTLTIEFALHGHGHASDWARQAQPGQTATILGPRGSMLLPTDWDWHLLVGDATALPAIHRRLEELPAGAAVRVLVQVPEAGDERRFDSAAHLGAGLQVQWVHSAEALLAALAAQPLPAGQGFAWCAGEAGLMRQTRALLLQQGQPATALHAAAYWKPGAADFHERLDA